MKVISLFSGAGGLDFGLLLAGNKIIWANDVDKDAVLTYRRNIGERLAEPAHSAGMHSGVYISPKMKSKNQRINA